MQIQHPELLENLKKAGFGDKEAHVYLAVLELGGAYPSRIAQHAGLNRSTTYHLLGDISIRGLVNEIKKKNKYFYQAEKPKKVIEQAERRKQRAEEQIERAQSILPDIEGLYGATGGRPKVTYYEGVEGVLDVFNDHVEVDEPYEMRAWSDAQELHTFLPKDFFDSYVKRKEQKAVTTRGLVPDTQKNRDFNEIRYKDIRKKYKLNLRFMEEGIFPFVGEITVYGKDKVSLVNFERSTMIGTIIEDKATHDAMGAIFELSWNSTLVSE